MFRDFGCIPRTVADDLTLPLLDAAGCREVELQAMEKFGDNEINLVRRAGTAAFALLQRRWPACQSISVFCGKGNNAADGYILAALAAQAGWQVEIICLEPPPTTDPGLTAHQEALTAGAVRRSLHINPDNATDNVTKASNSQDAEVAIRSDLIVDALLGTGLKGAPRLAYANQIARINSTNQPVLALDMPSGLGATGVQSAANMIVRASATISFIALKPALVTGSGVNFVGHLYLDGLGVPSRLLAEAANSLAWLTAANCTRLPARQAAAHKGDNGRVLLIGGAPGFGGAIILSTEMAVRAGAGLVAVATDTTHISPLLARVPEALAKPCRDKTDLAPLLDWSDVITCGPGLGTLPWSEQLLAAALNANQPLILDADALNMIAASPTHQKQLTARTAPTLLTPHPGEAARLLDCNILEIEDDRITASHTLAKRYQALVALKGAGTVLANRTQPLGICAHGNPGMAVAGMGDILSGLLPALIAQGLPPQQALTTAICLHSRAADQLATQNGTIGLTASDLIAPIRKLLN